MVPGRKAPQTKAPKQAIQLANGATPKGMRHELSVGLSEEAACQTGGSPQAARAHRTPPKGRRKAGARLSSGSRRGARRRQQQHAPCLGEALGSPFSPG